MFPFTWVFLFQNVSYFLDSPRTTAVLQYWVQGNETFGSLKNCVQCVTCRKTAVLFTADGTWDQVGRPTGFQRAVCRVERMRYPKGLWEWPGGTGGCLPVLKTLHRQQIKVWCSAKSWLVPNPFIFRTTRPRYQPCQQDILRRESAETAVKNVGNMWLAVLVEPLDWFIVCASFLLVLLHFVTPFNAQGIPGDWTWYLWALSMVILLEPRSLRWLLDFWKICAPLILTYFLHNFGKLHWTTSLLAYSVAIISQSNINLIYIIWHDMVWYII
jgi:hypothetical protein